MNTFRRTDEVKVLRDPVHSHIQVEYEVIWKLINSAWVQRMRRIRQLGGAFMVYHTADHTRFSHSLGVYEIVRRMVTEVPDIASALTEKLPSSSSPPSEAEPPMSVTSSDQVMP